MPAESSHAVFLSYASQDAAAARRIAEALRATGVEVWLDQSELRGGDAWDQNIRRQIKECALFIPIISANTQARSEGYFRLEWKLADDRTHLKARGAPFLLPVCIDDTKDWDAIVPDSFTIVQWIRLPGGEASSAFCERVKALLGKREPAGTASRRDSSEPSRRIVAPARNSSRRWLAPAFIAVAAAVAIAIWQPWKIGASPETKASAPLSEARQLTLQARALIDDDALDLRENYFLADELARRAVALSPSDGEAWATAGRISTLMARRKFDGSPARKDDARRQVERAVTLAPASIESGLALALHHHLNNRREDSERLLVELTQRAPGDRRVWAYLGLVCQSGKRYEDALGHFRRAQSLPGTDPHSGAGEAEALVRLGRFQEGRAKYEQMLAERPTRAAYLGHLVHLGMHVFDIPATRALMAKIPPRVMQEDAVVSTATEFFLRTGEADRALEELRRMPRDFFEDGWDWRPKGYLAGYAHRTAGREVAAQAEWKQALAVVEKRLAIEPTASLLLHWKCLLQALTGQVAAARESRGLLRELSPTGSVWFDAIRLVALEEPEAAIVRLVEEWPKLDITARNELRAEFLYAPWLVAIRNDPRIQSMAAEHSKLIEKATIQTSASVPADLKSVAVLAFENQSGDRENDYFSDGISDELLNQLGKVPGLRVAGRTSAFSFKGKNVPEAEIAQKLGVAYIVNGAVQKVGTQVRINARLVNAADGFQIWSEKFTRELKDIFAVQDEIAGRIAENLQLRLGYTPRVSKSVNPEAHRLVLEARYFWNLRTRDGFARAETRLAQALTLDPNFAQAHAAMADVCAMRATYAMQDGALISTTKIDIERARSEAQRAIALDPLLAEAYPALAYCFVLEARFQDAEQQFQKALSLNPNYGVTHAWYAMLRLAQGRLDEAMLEFQKSLELEPLWAATLSNYGETTLFTQRYGETLQLAERVSALRPDHFVQSLGTKARALLAVGRTAEAVETARFIRLHLDKNPRRDADSSAIWVLCQAGFQSEAEAHAEALFRTLPEESQQKGYALGALGRFEEALPYLERTPTLPRRRLYWDPIWDPWRNDPRFHQLLVKLGCVEEYKVARQALARLLKDTGK